MTDTTSAVNSTSPLQSYLNQQAQQIAAQQAAQASGAATAGNSALAQSTSASTIGSNFNTFINILTTQLQNQDPTNATDPNQFTQELVEFAGVEQQLNTNNDLQTIIGLQNASSLATGAGYIGNYVEAPSPNDTIALQDSSSEFNYQLPSAAGSVNLTITDASGNTVATMSGTGNNGSNYVSWNGLESDGTTAPDGNYTVTVAATDSAGDTIKPSGFNAITKVASVQTPSSTTTSSSSTPVGLELVGGTGLAVTTSTIAGLYTPSTLPNSTALVANTTQSGS